LEKHENGKCGECTEFSTDDTAKKHKYLGEHLGTILMKDKNTSNIIMSHFIDKLTKEHGKKTGSSNNGEDTDDGGVNSTTKSPFKFFGDDIILIV
jgi:hypothetical protein